MSETTERDHTHVCPSCGDAWLHANDECREPETPLPIAWVRRSWAKCPLHEGRDDE